MIRTAIISLHYKSPEGAEAQPENAALQAIRAVLAQGDFTEVDYIQIEPAQAMLRAKLRMIADTDAADLILTLGGIGLDIQDRVPEATADTFEREVPGIAELIRLTLFKKTRRAALYRNLAGVRKCTLIVNLPPEAAAAKMACEAIVGILPTAIDTIKYDSPY